MTEKTVVVPSLVLSYTGVFSIRNIEDTIRNYMVKTNYVLADVSHDISVKDKEKHQSITFFYTHDPHTQEQCRLRIVVSAQGIIPHVHRSSNSVEQLYEGSLQITMRATTYSNADDHKQHKPISYALKTLFGKFVYSEGHHEIGHEMKKYCYDLYDQIYGLVNMGKHPDGSNA